MPPLLKRTESNHFTIAQISSAMDRLSLCETCANDDCIMKKLLARSEVNSAGAIVTIKTCMSFMPTIFFQDSSGTEGSFNTFRLAGAWAKRVKPGDVVGLARKPGGVYGRAQVTDVHFGIFKALAKRHSRFNHLAIAAKCDSADFDLKSAMERAYGKNRFDLASAVSVLYFERL